MGVVATIRDRSSGDNAIAQCMAATANALSPPSPLRRRACGKHQGRARHRGEELRDRTQVPRAPEVGPILWRVPTSTRAALLGQAAWGGATPSIRRDRPVAVGRVARRTTSPGPSTSRPARACSRNRGPPSHRLVRRRARCDDWRSRPATRMALRLTRDDALALGEELNLT
jgi:hypothetical protein